MEPANIAARDLIVVACHAPFKESTAHVPADPAADDAWVLQEFQRGEPPFYIAHLRRGVEMLASSPDALLVLSGGHTRREAGSRWSEAATYFALAGHFNWWTGSEHAAEELRARTTLENFSRDSFENLLFSLCRFQQVTGRWPREVTLVSWAFKRARFMHHAETMRLPAERFHFAGCGEPLDIESARRGEAATLREFSTDLYGVSGALAAKRASRNPLGLQHDFASCPGVAEFFAFIEDPANATAAYTGALPWSDWPEARLLPRA
jgi:hypothetical protein